MMTWTKLILYCTALPLASAMAYAAPAKSPHMAAPAMKPHAAAAVNPPAAAAASDATLIASASNAAPAAVARDATIVAVAADGSMREVRKGSNGFTCMADNPATPGPDPMCGDANAMDWAMAWMNHKAPDPQKVGFMYMLAGGTDASNTDPYAQGPAATNHWIKTGPHVMILGAPANMASYPTAPDPDTSKPYVMWAGTPYAHLMIPVR